MPRSINDLEGGVEKRSKRGRGKRSIFEVKERKFKKNRLNTH